MEKEADVMAKDIKISLPFYKNAYAFCFIVILSLVRGIAFTNEIGIALEPPVAILATVFCADTYTREIASKRSEVWRLYPLRNRLVSLCRRMAAQEIFLLLLAITGYGLFLLAQKPVPLYGVGQERINEIAMFQIYVMAIFVTIHFWGMLFLTISCLFRNMWVGIGGSFILWIMTYSAAGEKYLGKWNLFSYTFRNVEDNTDMSWACGKMVCVFLSIVMIMMLPKIIRTTSADTSCMFRRGNIIV